MGKRKKSSRKPQGPKKRQPLPTTFECLFCNHENSVSIKMDKKAGIGELSCKICGQQFQTDLSGAVDVYSDWIDACDAVAKDARTADESARQRQSHGAQSGSNIPRHEQDIHPSVDDYNVGDIDD